MGNALNGFVRVAAASPVIRVADCKYNAERILDIIGKARDEGVKVLCLPELCLTGYTCGDLFGQETLLEGALEALSELIEKSADLPVLTAAGLPLAYEGKLFNVAAVFCCGRLLGIVPKTYLPNYGEFYEMRHFSPALPETRRVTVCGAEVPMGVKILFQNEQEPDLRIGVELCEDLWVPIPPSSYHAMAGAVVIANLSASDDVIGKEGYRKNLAAAHSGRLVCGYIYANAGQGESSTDMVFGANNLVCENGRTLAESPSFGNGWAEAEIDLRALKHDRGRFNTWQTDRSGYEIVPFSLDTKLADARRRFERRPFVPDDEGERAARCETILDMQTAGLGKRLEHTGAKTAVVGVSGGLDSALALLVAARAMPKTGGLASDVTAVTMPCFGTTSRTKKNALALCDALGISCREIDITNSVRAHLRDIGHSEDARDTVYENAQARVRTLVLMDLANQLGGIAVGTGDLSELAIGWSTYNGDHMSMYGVNAGVPKTLVRHIVKYVADTSPKLAAVLTDILDTPVSPELLPSSDGGVGQRTENIVGPYELHDFFLYHVVRWGRAPKDVLALGSHAFDGLYGPEEILKWLRLFYRRFFASQFKRSCLPDGPKIGSVSLSPRGDWRMPSDAVCDAWLRELEES
ncbi:MAG: NAD(+) synthase [Synergistaceae bacterium]|jgi:NAD+ synthase (glutamine-hydrolysing)|nr:NAD(+) synthase [Synergistaceae bacterium]